MATHLFIDTNIFLAFYHYTSDDLEELSKLSHLLGQNEINLYLPEQVIQEFRRNRENKISASLQNLRGQTLALRFPQLCKEYPEYHELRKLQLQYEKQHNRLLKKLTGDIEAKKLKADQVIEELFDRSHDIKVTDYLVELAQLRMALGNPPGKKGSLGDALNWESLLRTVPKRRIIYFISDDKDYCSPLNSNAFNRPYTEYGL